jgi:hypothetical protein
MATAAYLPTPPAPNNGMSALHASVLVLNRQYMAIHVIDVRRAFTLLLRELAEVIHIEDGQYANYDFDSWRDLSALRAQYPDDVETDPHADWVRSINFQIQAPRILRLLH